MDKDSYLQRIKYDGNPSSSLSVLKDLQKKHLLQVPFENLDIHWGKEIRLDPNLLFTKVVLDRRGGFCYELNGLFCTLLKLIGFEAKMVSARMWNKDKAEFGPEFDHLALIVKVDRLEYLVDVGAGDFSVGPLPIIVGKEIKDERSKFKFQQFNDTHILVSKWTSSYWKREYIFSKQERTLDEFEDMCRFQQTSPDSHFTKNKVCSRLTEVGRITLTGKTFKETQNGVVIERPFGDEATFYDLLKEFFGMVL